MSERIFIAVAWPYANGHLHTGHIAGCYLPADIFARFHRLKGNDVLMVSGSDAHGTPNTVRAEEEGVPTKVIVDRYHTSFMNTWDKLGISWDLFTSTMTENHKQVTQEIFLKLLEQGHIYKNTTPLPFCPNESRFLPDRYVIGTCPRCGNTNARGDECDSCGHPLDPFDLLEPQCRFCNTPPVPRDSEHFFLRLSGFASELHSWIQKQTSWRPNVYNFTLRFIEDGLHDRAITRDIEWGVPIPLPGYETKRFYVWFENIIGYLSASKEWAQRQGDPELWKAFWQQPQTRAYYFIGKDNIFFHTISWPAEILGYGNLNLPYDVPANEFMNLEGRKISTSRNWAVWIPDFLSRYEPDQLRYYLTAIMPETSDSDFSWREFVRRNNDELVATFGNLVHRVLTFTYRNFGGVIPTPSILDGQSIQLQAKAQIYFEEVETQLSQCHFKNALNAAMALAQEANRYLDHQAPWHSIKEDRDMAATTLWVSISIINCLKMLLCPFLPFSSQQLHEMLGFPGQITDGKWHWSPELSALPPGQPLGKPEPLYSKLEDGTADEEIARMSSNLAP